MSTALLQNVPATVSAALDEIEGSSATSDTVPTNHTVGPFGVFDAGVATSHGKETSSLNAPMSCTSLHTASDFEIAAQHNSTPPSQIYGQDVGQTDGCGVSLDWPGGFDDLLTSSLDSMQWADLFQWDFGMSKQLADAQPPVDVSFVQNEQTDHLRGDDLDEALAPEGSKICSTDAGYQDAIWPQLDLGSQAPSLLKHFNDVVITQMGSLPVNEKSAWRILNFPSAVFTLSQLTTLAIDKHDIKHANLANFFAVIAASALHLSLSPSKAQEQTNSFQDWKSLSERTYDAAKQHMRLSLDTECMPPRKAKYKDQLMAIGAILATAVSSCVMFPGGYDLTLLNSYCLATTRMAGTT